MGVEAPEQMGDSLAGGKMLAELVGQVLEVLNSSQRFLAFCGVTMEV